MTLNDGVKRTFEDVRLQPEDRAISPFVEVGVDIATGESRIHKMLAVWAAERILNPITARSQVISAMMMGAGRRFQRSLRWIPAVASSSIMTWRVTRWRFMPTFQ
ncbi:hypothetical protein GGE60_004936 [Rhizobium leucaenae]|uniref:Aldehyde oxidase/xanthine dehydrogenase second molybdopterin binding domain-containing protein n=1 Tax=Rhizobium leucaenae TaxID=29450 RepID=A0A7W7EMR0_9HYPH|nr:hypothetical protein [Rhizobium leucaenae]